MRAIRIALLVASTVGVAACNETLPEGERDVFTGLSAVELLECQESGDSECPSPEDPDLFCCRIATGSTCDCFSVGGTMGAGGTCSSVCDGGGGERLQDENGCWYWTTPSAAGCMMFETGGPDAGPSSDAEPGPSDAAPFEGPPHDSGGGTDAGSPRNDTGSSDDTGSRADTGAPTDASVIDAG